MLTLATARPEWQATDSGVAPAAADEEDFADSDAHAVTSAPGVQSGQGVPQRQLAPGAQAARFYTGFGVAAHRRPQPPSTLSDQTTCCSHKAVKQAWVHPLALDPSATNNNAQ